MYLKAFKTNSLSYRNQLIDFLKKSTMMLIVNRLTSVLVSHKFRPASDYLRSKTKTRNQNRIKRIKNKIGICNFSLTIVRAEIFYQGNRKWKLKQDTFECFQQLHSFFRNIFEHFFTLFYKKVKLQVLYSVKTKNEFNKWCIPGGISYFSRTF